MPFVSVIIPVYNEEKHLDMCLKSIIEMSYPKELYEIIVVDNGSDDNSIDIASKYTDKVFICPNIKVGEMRNYGAIKAKGEIYAFIDADCVADKEWIMNAIELIKDNYCITGSKVDIPTNSNWIEKTWYANKKFVKTNTSYINSGNMILPAKLFNELNGFNTNLSSGEDAEICYRARKFAEIISDPKIRVTHYGNPKTMLQFLRREIWHGLGAFGTFKINYIDLPLFGTILFLMSIILVLIGLFVIIFKHEYVLFIIGLIYNISIVILSSLYKYKFNKNLSLRLYFQVGVLYYLYYIGRVISFYHIIWNKKISNKVRDYGIKR